MSADVKAAGIESVELPAFPDAVDKGSAKYADVIKAADEAFESSDLLSILKQNSLENRDKCGSLPMSMMHRWFDQSWSMSFLTWSGVPRMAEASSAFLQPWVPVDNELLIARTGTKRLLVTNIVSGKPRWEWATAGVYASFQAQPRMASNVPLTGWQKFWGLSLSQKYRWTCSENDFDVIVNLMAL
jgi:hypothetical protein